VPHLHSHLIAGYFLGLIAALFLFSFLSLEGEVSKERNRPLTQAAFDDMGVGGERSEISEGEG
jgi:hypothetical protein